MEINDYIKRAKNGDQKAFKYLLDTYWDDVFRFQQSLIKNSDEAEDITLETFAKAFEKIHTFNEKYAFKNWLLTISKNVYTDLKRKKKSKQIFVSLEEVKEQKETGDTLSDEEKIILEQKLKELKKAMKILRPDYREILEYRYFHDMSYKAIAEKTGKTVANTKVRLMRAKKLLAEIIQKNQTDD